MGPLLTAEAGTWVPIALSAAAVVVVASGVRLTLLGRPYGGGLLAVHKLVDLAGTVAVAVVAYGALRRAADPAGLALAGAAIAASVATFATGGVLSAAKGASPAAVVWAHRLGGFAVVALAAWAVVHFGGAA